VRFALLGGAAVLVTHSALDEIETPRPQKDEREQQASARAGGAIRNILRRGKARTAGGRRPICWRVPTQGAACYWRSSTPLLSAEIAPMSVLRATIIAPLELSEEGNDPHVRLTKITT
jgi:hypothetical protein